MQAPSPQQGCDPGRGYAEYIIQNARLDESQHGVILLGEMATTSHMQMVPL